MKQINYVIGDATNPQRKDLTEKVIIPHICNNIGGWGAGFVLALSKKWKGPELNYRSWFESKTNFELGAIQCVDVDDTTQVVNMIAQNGIISYNNQKPIKYDALEKALNLVATVAKYEKASIHMPRIGAGLAGGDWSVIEAIIIKTLCAKNFDVYVYDLPK